jgi:hypothetical protein
MNSPKSDPALDNLIRATLRATTAQASPAREARRNLLRRAAEQQRHQPQRHHWLRYWLAQNSGFSPRDACGDVLVCLHLDFMMFHQMIR